jgi:hypothetical protein
MKFNQILGKCDPSIVLESSERLSATFTELAMGYKTKAFGSKMGGDVFLHQLVSPLKQVCDARALEFDEEVEKMKSNPSLEELTKKEKEELIQEIKQQLGGKLLRTAATNGTTFFWAPQFINKLSRIGLRLVVGHEGWHAIYMHPTRRGSRGKALWNIAVDFKVNFTLMEDLRMREFYNADDIFRTELGDFITLEEYANFLKDPFNPPQKLANWNPTESMKKMLNPGYETSGAKGQSFYYAEPKLSDELKRPENIYDYLLSKIPKCNTCGKVGVWKKPKEYLDMEKELSEINEKATQEHNHEQ